MPVFTTKLLQKKEIAKDTMEFLFEKPAGLIYKAGNSFDWTFITSENPEDSSRTFSNASAPYENHISFITRMRNTVYKQILKHADSGFEVKVEGPFGSFHLHDDTKKPAIFLAGGIGISPYMSMIKQSLYENSGHKIFLFYSNKTLDDVTYHQELYDLQRKSQNLKIIHTLTRSKNENGETGYIGLDMIKKHILDVHNAIFYLAGPSLMVYGVRDILFDSGIDEENIKWEEFSGY